MQARSILIGHSLKLRFASIQGFNSNPTEDPAFPVNIYLFKVTNRNTRKRCEICSKLTIKTPERRPHLFLVFLLLTLNK